jgi:hypothetical protein
VAREKLAAAAKSDGDRDALLAAAIDEAARHQLTYLRLYLQVRRAYLLLRQHRLGEAGRLLGDVRAAAHASGYWNWEMIALFQLASLASRRQEAAAVKAYGEEVLRGETNCALRVGVAEILAERAMNDAHPEDARWALGQLGGCDVKNHFRLPGLHALSELAALDPRGPDATTFREALAAMRPRLTAGERLTATALEGRAVIATDRAQGRRLLEQVVESTAGGGSLATEKPRLLAFRRLISDAAQARDLQRAITLIAGESNLDVPSGCLLALAEDMRRPIVISRGASGDLAGGVGERTATVVPDDLVPAEHQARLAGCPEVAVLALPPYYGRSRLLPADIAWRHYAGHEPGARWTGERRLVVSDVTPPRDLELPTLPAWRPSEGSYPYKHLQGPEATASQVQRAMQEADLVEFHVHGIFDPARNDDAFLVLSPDERGEALLTASAVRALSLPRNPFVVLAACNSALNSPSFPSYSGRLSLPAAFLAAGARGVVAATAPIPDLAARAFIAELERKLRAQSSAALALREVRVRWLAEHPSDGWVRDVVLFQ